jgi:hypothetical protein
MQVGESRLAIVLRVALLGPWLWWRRSCSWRWQRPSNTTDYLNAYTHSPTHTHPPSGHCNCHRICNAQPESPRHPANLRERRPVCSASRHRVGGRRRIRRSSHRRQLRAAGLSYRRCGGSRHGPREADKILGGHTGCRLASLRLQRKSMHMAGWAHQHTPSSRSWPLRRPPRHRPGRR